MTREILVIGSVNHDRVWQLAAPLVPGARLDWCSRRMTLGGGGLNTGMRLLSLGRPVALVTQVAEDRRGTATRAFLARAGFGMDGVATVPGPARITEILLGADGERTILFPPGARPPLEARPGPACAAYVNARRLGPGLRAALGRVALVMTQLPPGAADARPADIAITSRADFPGSAPRDLLAQARRLCGPRLRLLVLTDGARPVTLLGSGPEAEEVSVPPGPRVRVANATGAGDSFAAAFLHATLDGAAPAGAAAEACRLTALWLEDRPPLALPADAAPRPGA
ncbi:PfkB family carbohydrate kinase [Oceanicella sp. SM1341]|uniref:PfkB family carbohydrate kinase n=1 Tax=Oceanicella sp. SM1341 TaxID=1548889 RepID=UPI001300404F|nr:PfkB family carbohydrate kinase [Oceanicella sp. SM1341]